MMALARGPGSGILIWGEFEVIWSALVVIPLLSFPTGPGCRVFQQDTASGQVVADAVGRRKIAPAPRGVPLLDEPFDLIHRDWRLLVFGTAQAQYAEHTIEFVERRLDHRHIVSADAACVDGGVHAAH